MDKASEQGSVSRDLRYEKLPHVEDEWEVWFGQQTRQVQRAWRGKEHCVLEEQEERCSDWSMVKKREGVGPWVVGVDAGQPYNWSIFF